MMKGFVAFALFLFAFPLAFAAIPLTGVTGEKMRVRAFFDVNNVKVGDPMVLTVDFLGSADFKALHPPELSRAVDRRDWKIDDTSAKTQTESQRVGGFFSSREVDVARRLTYRVRPMREGVLWFPALEFAYQTPTGQKRTVRANEIPVHAKPGVDVVVEEMGEDERMLPQPDGLIADAGVPLTDDESFAWRRACANATNADAFAEFDFPAARLNEARCALLEGNWARAMKIYQRLEWRTGQTPEIERGIVAALALRYENPTAELPVWRQVGRPLLRHDWRGRIGWALGGLTAFALVFWLLGKVIRALACVAVAALLVLPAAAQSQDPFAAMEQMLKQQRKQMQQFMSGSFGGGNFSFGFGGEEREPPKVVAHLQLSNPKPRVGERFDFIVSLEVPKNCTVEPSNFSPTRNFGLTFVTGRGEMLTDGRSSDTNCVVKRVAIPARYDVPFKGNIAFAVTGMVTGRQTGGRRGGFSFSFSNSFEAKTPDVPIEVRPLENPPEGFSGVVATALRFEEETDSLRVGTNDVMRIVYRMSLNGWLPEDWLPEGAAFEWGRNADRNGAVTAEWQRYFVADGAAATPVAKVVYYDPKAKKYKSATAGGKKIRYE